MVDKNLIIKFIKAPHNEETAKDGYKNLLSFFESIAYKFKISEDVVGLYHQFIIEKILFNDTFQNFLLSASDSDITPYLKRMISNFMINICKKHSEIYDIHFDIEEIKDSRLSSEIKLESLFLIELFNTNLNQKEKKLLCNYLAPKRYNFLDSMESNAFYKGVERLKTKLKGIISQSSVSKEGLDIFFSDVYLSEVCDKICLDN